MFKNYLKTAINNLLGDRLYSGINIAGLAFGLAATILIALYVLGETSYDRQWENADRIYRVNSSSRTLGGGFRRSAGTPMPVLPALRSYFPQVIDAGTRFMSLDSQIRVGDRGFEETIHRVDSGFLDLFRLDIVAGSLDEALTDPGRIALRADVAQRFFGTSAPAAAIGQTLTAVFNGVARDYDVAAIYRFPPGSSVLDLPMLTLLDTTVLPPFYDNWGGFTMDSYLRLSPGTRVEAVNGALPEFVDQSAGVSGLQLEPGERLSDRLRFDLQNITDIHLNSPFDDSRAGGSQTVVIAFTAIAVLVLLIGVINFTILSTAKAAKRAKETALRKTVGATRRELISQFVGESFCIVAPALLVSCVLVELLLPVFETMVGKTLVINWLELDTLLALGSLYAVVGMLGGLYPAFVLSRFRPASTLRAARITERAGTLNLRTLLVVFQFGVSIALIIATGVIYLQVRYAMNRDPGFNREQVLVIDNLRLRAEVNARKQTLKTQLLELDAVTDATLSIHQPTQSLGLGNISARYAIPGQSSTSQITTLGIDPDFFGTYQTEIVAGRGFAAELDQPAEILTDQAGGPRPSKVMINVSASRQLGFASADAAVGSQIQFRNPTNNDAYDLTIIGVAADTNFYSTNAIPRSEVYSFSPEFTDVLSLRFEGDPQSVLAQVADVWRSVMGDAELSSSFVEQSMEREFAQERVEAQLLVSFALLAVLIACLGLYGSASFTVDRRAKEVGIRKVLGAEVSDLVTMLAWQFSRPVLIANFFAWPAAVWAMLRWLQRFPYQIDYVVLIPLCVMAGALALSIAWLTVAGNTLRVATTRPVLALRYE